MEKTLNVAKALYTMYQGTYGTPMDEMKMHKLMYFANRESLIKYKSPLFNAVFEAWKFGPVLLDVRKEYRHRNPFFHHSGKVSSQTKELLSFVISKYGNLDSWKLSSLSHEELSWKYARNGLNPGENGNALMDPKIMQIDAQTELLKRKAVVN